MNSYQHILKEGIEKGIEQGIEKGIEQGDKIRTKKTALQMIQEGFEDKIILRILNISQTALNKIKAEIKKK